MHGTGVRADKYTTTFGTVREALWELAPEREVRGCFWGAREGARLLFNGASIPGYADSGGGVDEKADEDIALWGVLYTDPWYELRLLGLGALPVVRTVPGGVSPAEEFRTAVQSFTPSGELLTLLARHDLGGFFSNALVALRRARELEEAARTADTGGHEHRHAAARALTAHTLAAAAELRDIALTGLARDALAAQISAELGGQARSLAERLKRAGAHGLTWQVHRRRGSYTDQGFAFVADILRYQARGDGVRSLLRRTIEDTPGDRVTVIGHSLGGIAAVDLLALAPVPRVDQLITIGSQAAFFYETGALVCREHPAELPPYFPERWLNIYDPRDFLSYRAADVFRGRVRDVRVDNGQPFPQAHSAYWDNDSVWDVVRTWLG
ncbi:esterase/lipase family protein [Streptomyces sp. NPDC086549]|uniref:esterase/lipase family protein n=1 Tax=Streptomyces sp. NPDC086549 TaxID=3365752 RepID=UPI0037F13C20